MSRLPVGLVLHAECAGFAMFLQSLTHASTNHRLAHASERIARAEASMAILREGRVIRHRLIELEPAEPSMGQVQMDFFA